MENTKNSTLREMEEKEKSEGIKSRTYRNTALKISPKSNNCIYFSKYNYCKFGNKCHFLHDQQFTKKDSNKEKNITFENCPPLSQANHKIGFTNQTFLNRKKLCYYFKAGNCDKGEFCRYHHVLVDDKALEPSSTVLISQKVKKKRVPICHYFKKGNCQRGENCKFYHNLSQIALNKTESDYKDEVNAEILNTSDSPDLIGNETILESNSHFVPRTVSIVSNKKFYDVSSLKEDDLYNLRDTEINLLKKRFPNHRLSEKNSILFTFEPSDPDWPFDLKALDLEIFFPEKYPLAVCKIDVLLSSNNIPEMLIRYLNHNISDWIENRSMELKLLSQVELIFRPFLKWFDKNLEELFICGLKKVKRDIEAKNNGIEFVPVEKLFSSSYDSDKKIFEEQEIPFQEEQLPLDLIKEIHENNYSPPLKSANAIENAALKQGIKVLFGGLELLDGIATISCNKLAVTVQCIRCKTPCNMKCMPGKNSSLKCTKCSKVIECNFSPSILHQFSSVAGNLNAVECQVADINLVESAFHVDCLNCSKQIVIDGLHYGQKQKRWCLFCNEKMIFSIESVKFQAISSTYIAAKNVSIKKTEKRKDPLFKEGETLPNFGTCKHYKKSYRWLRFPCCGRLYPCDECHNEKEVDHEMKFASRMICGFCSKEQPYSKEKSCSSCSGSMTAKSGAHWEGGKGCRNKIKMSRDDKHKYVGTSKTVSKKAQSVKTGKKK